MNHSGPGEVLPHQFQPRRVWMDDPLHLKGLFAPEKLALVGASKDRSRFGGKVLDRLERFGGDRQIFRVNPSSPEIRGVPCFSSLQDLPEAPDHVAIAVPFERIFDVLADCEAVGTQFVTIFSGGFAETGTEEGVNRQNELKSFAERTGIRILGPNCNGLINFVDRFALTSSAAAIAGKSQAGNIGLVAQSGGLAQVNVLWRAQQIGLGLSYEVSCGNCADLDVLDFTRFMIADEHTDVIMVVAEALTDGEAMFRVAAEAEARRKPVIILKLGRTEAGSRAAASHTGALTGSDEIHDAAFRQCGFIRVDDCGALYETAMLLRTRRVPAGRRAAALSVSGGNAVLLADLGAREGLQWPDYTVSTQEKLRAILPKHGTAGNPTDVTNAAVGHPDMYAKCIAEIAADVNVDMIVPIITFGVKSDLEQAATIATLDKPAAILWTGGCSDDPDMVPHVLIERGIPVFRDTLNCVRALNAAATYGEFLAKRSSAVETAWERPVGMDEATARGLISAEKGVLSERKSKQILAAYGLPVTKEILTTTAEQAIQAASSIGHAVAMKIESKEIPHKTEAKAIRLHVHGDEEVKTAFSEIMQAASLYAPSATLDGVLVQEMARPDGLELILGVVRDAVFGPVVMVGLGGIYAEVLKDVSFRVAPVTPNDATEMLQELRAFQILQGARGNAPKDVDVLCDLICRLSWLAHDLKDRIAELDINPLLVYPQKSGALVVDALISLTEARGILYSDALEPI